MALTRCSASSLCFWSNFKFVFKTVTPCSRFSKKENPLKLIIEWLGARLTQLLFHPFCYKSRGFRYSHCPMLANSNGVGHNSTHLQRTENSPRQESFSSATVTEITQLSKTVKGLCLKVEDNRFIFKPGQWVDFFIPGVATVGGFSICSSPRELKDTSTIELAVKHSNHPPALWVHTKCCVGSKVHMRVGGNFYFDPKPSDSSPDLLLIAGGVGINPIYSIVQHVADISHYQHTGKTVLLFSAQNQDELLFKDSLMEISRKYPSIVCKYFVTKPETGAGGTQPLYEHGRINESRLQEVVSSLDRSQLTCYICGPPPMIKQVSDILYKLDIAENRIHFEKWW